MREEPTLRLYYVGWASRGHPSLGTASFLLPEFCLAQKRSRHGAAAVRRTKRGAGHNRCAFWVTHVDLYYPSHVCGTVPVHACGNSACLRDTWCMQQTLRLHCVGWASSGYPSLGTASFFLPKFCLVQDCDRRAAQKENAEHCMNCCYPCVGRRRLCVWHAFASTDAVMNLARSRKRGEPGKNTWIGHDFHIFLNITWN